MAAGRALIAVAAAALVMCAVGRVATAADEATPSGGQPVPENAAPAVGDTQPMDFEVAAKGVAMAYPIQLDRMVQVTQNSFNWHGPDDASLRCQVGFSAAAIVIRGDFRDDLPFVQAMARPARADWWRIGYGADGLEFAFDNPTSAGASVKLAFNFGSQALDPRVELIENPSGLPNGFIPSANLRLFDDPVSKGAIHFEAAIPITAVAEPRFFAGPLRITARMHDMDGGPETYKMLQQAIEKKP